jgi:hypothetical protein
MEDISLKIPVDDWYECETLKGAPNQLMRELMAYRATRGLDGKEFIRGPLLKGAKFKSATQHMINAIQLIWTPDEVRFSNGPYVNWNIIKVIQALNEHDDLGIAGAASSGKTYGMAVWTLVDWMCAPYCTSTFVASTTLKASADRLWGTIEGLFHQAKKNMQEKYHMDIGATHVAYQHAIIYGNVDQKDPDRESKNAIKALAFETGNQGQKAVDETRGRKNTRVRMLVDELAEMEPFVLNTRINLTANEDFVFCGTANPSNKSQNPHKELCQPDHEMGWESVNKDMDGWPTRTGYCLFLSGERNPNFQVPKGSPRLFKGIMSYEKLDDILKKCLGNRNSIEYWRNAIGFWPDVSVELNVLSKAFIQAAEINYEPEWTSDTKTVAGFDCAFKSGGDRNCLSFFKVGDDDTKRKVGFFLGTKQYVANVGEEYEKSIAKQVVADCREAGVAPADFGMDISGDGGVMMKAIMEEWSLYDPSALSIHPISSAGSPTERVLSAEDTRTAKQAYDRLITEYWFWGRNAIGNRCILGLDLKIHAPLVAELTERIYEHKGSKVAIETKKLLKERLGKSCDEADCWIYGTIMCRRAGVEIISGTAPKPKEEIDPALAEYFLTLENKKEEPEEDYSYSGSQADPDGFY